MPRSTRRVSSRTGYRDRHGRGIRSAVTGPHLPMLHTRLDFFDSCVASAVEYLRTVWPDELASVRFDVMALPPAPAHPDGVERWRIDRAHSRVVLFRVPIQRLAHLHRNDDWHRRSYIESCVFRAVAELLGKDPWDLAPERFRHF